jgi:hypothetical protein
MQRMRTSHKLWPVLGILEDIGEKPLLIDYRRVGTVKTGKNRPIKVKLSSAEAAFHVLSKSKLLKSSEENGSTYIVADRTQEERDAFKKLIDQMRVRMNQQPTLYHFIKDGQIKSVPRRAGNDSQIADF